MVFFSFCQTIPKFVPVSEHGKSSITSENLERNFLFYIPKKPNPNGFPIVFVLHGGGGTGEGMIYLTRISEVAERDGFIVVYPNGLENRWNDGRGITRFLTDQRNTNDVQFFRDMTRHFKSNFRVDDQRIHVVGLSNGGFMAQRILCEASDLFASGFSIAATTSVYLSKECKLNEPISIGFIFGKKDDIIPYSGGTILVPTSQELNSPRLPAGESISFLQSLEVWKKRLGCENESIHNIDSLKKRRDKDILKYTYQNCRRNSLLDGYLIESGGHFWPHGFYYTNESKYGYLTQDLDATKVVIDFFKRTPKNVIGVN